MTIKWGILGAGSIADREMAPAMKLANGHCLVAIMRRNGVQARAFATRHGVPRSYDRVEDIVLDPEVDAIYVATPPHLHAANSIQAAEHGKHVLCEKPMALNVAQAETMVEACRANHVRLMLCHYQRFNSRHQQIKHWLDAGRIGQVTAARLQFSDYYPPTPDAWRHDASISGGGPLLDLAPHCLDLLLYLCGPVVELCAMLDTLASNSPVEDTATLVLRLASGAQAVLTTHWSTPSFDAEALSRLELYGTKGSIIAAPLHSKDSSGKVRLATVEGVQDVFVAPEDLRPHVALLEAFGEALNAGLPVPIPGEEGLQGMRLIQAAYQSARTGCKVRI